MYGSYHGYGAYGQQLDYRPLFARHWHSPHYKYSEVLGGTYHIPHSRYPPHDVYKTPCNELRVCALVCVIATMLLLL
uniref:Uncharacterized protein n=1 Tax=Meloidogyne enterolobii TaxID=390850 RepID=A0A6V7UIY1_MELEN|nr:unnamed protein product [Meloidogyne enterolobii]